MMGFSILLRLLAAHLMADFFLQFDWIAKGKFAKGAKGQLILAIHSLIHAVTAYVMVGQWNQWVIPALIFATHFIIDTAKVRLDGKGLWGFLFDQACHVGVILLLWWSVYADKSELLCQLAAIGSSRALWTVVVAYMLVLKPTSILIGIFINRWTPSNGMQSHGMPLAGAWIGYIERVLIVTFVLTDSIEAVGFLLAAKSIFRFGDLSRAREVKITEYVLLGTLASFTAALLVAFSAKMLL